ncbi:hypothetical protein Q9S36_08860 [Microbacterium sp. ARD31]|uniref:hypothetical protein n=1 Tax=Microbacterium sp. ARD31 TaxID=2962576 RepID=UPI002881B1F7|nr:hypothetical protein [Microbacterium sp. ARD31]MDT0180317.1 hypothetical protein [Microbacterium sp. ARD31]
MATPARTPLTTRLSRWIAATIVAVLATLGVLLTAAPAQAASRGVGFGTWAPTSAHGWHGSMLIDGVHTYCILPGKPLPTGPSVDHGISADARGLTPAQLTGINLLVTRYGQTSDPVQAAAVGWAVKAIADWDETLHHFGYRGDSLAGAINWTFSALAPDHNAAVQKRAVAYYKEAMAIGPGPTTPTGSLTIAVDPDDPARGSVQVDSATAATGTLALENAVFSDTGTSERKDAATGVSYPIDAVPPAPGRAFHVSAAGSFQTGIAAAVRHYTTRGGQDTAGPAGPGRFRVEGRDEVPRHPLFAPTITTQALASVEPGDAFVDDVVVGGDLAHWPRDDDGAPIPVTATAVVYRTDAEPTLVEEGIPDGARAVGSLGATIENADTVRVTSAWALEEPGFYTAVWTIRREDQLAEVAAHLPADYTWVEAFGTPSQIVHVAAPPPAEPEPTPQPSPEAPPTPQEDVEAPSAAPPREPELAATGVDTESVRPAAGWAIGLMTTGGALLALRRGRFEASTPIG